MERNKITRAEMDLIDSRATYDASCNSWDYPDAHYDCDVYTFIDAIYDECKSVYHEDDFDDFMDWAIDNFNDYDVGNVDFFNEYCKWQKKEKAMMA